MKNFSSYQDKVIYQQIELPCFPEAQRLIDEFVCKAEDESELQRISLSQQLNKNWISSKLPMKVFPGVPDRNDYWFLVQLLSLHRYWLNDHEMLDFDLAKPKAILFPNSFLLDDYCERDIADKKIQDINSIALTESGVKRLWTAQLPQYDDLLRLSTLDTFQIPSKLLHLRGFRKRSDSTFNGLIGGNPMLGGWQHLDALPPNIPTKKIAISYYFVRQFAQL